MDDPIITKPPIKTAVRDADSPSGSVLEPVDAIQKIVSSLPADHSGTSIYVKGWRHASCKGHPILIVHDLGEQTGMYKQTIEEMVERGHNVFMFDLRGHGRSGKRLGHAPSYDILINDLLQVAAWVRHKESGMAPIIIGNGIGALITMDFTKRYPALCRGMVLSAPCLELVHETTGLTRFFIKILADIAPMLRIPISLCPQFTRDLMSIEHQIDEEDETSIVYFPRLTAIFANELLNAIKRAELSFITYEGSVLLLCPGKDDVCTYSAVKKAVAVHTADNIEVLDFPEHGHALLSEEASKSDVIEKIIQWVDKVTLLNLRPFKKQNNEPEIPPPPPSKIPFSIKPGATRT